MQGLYVVGGAGVGKSTFMAGLLDRLGAELEPLSEIHVKMHKAPTKTYRIAFRGHRIKGGGLYVGVMRDSFPGTDGLDRASGPIAEEWLDKHCDVSYIIAEGATFANRRFFSAMDRNSNFLVMHLVCDPVVVDLRLLERGSNQAETFVAGTVTKSANLLRDTGVRVHEVDTADPASWQRGIDAAAEWVLGRSGGLLR